MFTLILAAFETFGNAQFEELYIGTLILDIVLIIGLIKVLD